MEATEVVPGVWCAGTRYVNWYVVETDDGLTLVDAGLPKYREQLDHVLKLIRRQRSDIRALLLTHGHIDHVGMADVLAAEGAEVHLHPADHQLATDYKANKTQRSIVR
jgi:glyoxylase-like metal-dependent hydrolase (beta-lactamase superfamily II)